MPTLLISILLATFFAFGPSTLAYADDFSQSNERAIVAQVRTKAESGDVDSRYELGRFYEYGKHGLDVDLSEASRWYRSAATGGHVVSQRRLGHMSLSGDGLPQNFEQARQWFFLAANNGDSESQYELGVLFLAGRGVPKAVDRAIEWLGRSAESGNDDAQVALAMVYVSAEHIEPDFEKALPLLNKASNSGNVQAKYWIARLSETGRGIPLNLDRAHREHKAAADAGHIPSQLWLGAWYSSENELDIGEALHYYRLASQAGDPGGDVGIARLHIDQLVTHPDPQLAMKHLRKAVDAGNPEAHYLMGLLIGDGVIRGSEDKALSHLRYAASRGFLNAQFDLGSIYYNGAPGRSPDFGLAAHWWARAAKAGDVRAQYAYGAMMVFGRGIAQNQGVGYALVNISAAQGHPDAMSLREQLISSLNGQLLQEAQVLSLDLFDRYVDPAAAAARAQLK